MNDVSEVKVSKGVQKGRMVAVEFPLAIKPSRKGLDVALGMIGGKQELSLVTKDEERTLKLNNRPKDPLCRPLVAQRNTSEGSAFVFKVKRRRLRRSKASFGGHGAGPEDQSMSGGDGWSIASVEIVGAVNTSFTFHSLADVQFMSCRPRDEGVEEAIEEHITAALSRTEPMELVPASFLPPFPKVSQESRAEKLLRKEKQNEAVKLERGELLVHHHFGEDLKQRTKKGVTFIEEARALEHLEEELSKKWCIGKKKNADRSNRPYRMKIGISGHNEVKEQKLMLVLKILKIYEKRPMLSMAEITGLFDGDAVWPLRDVVPVVAYHICNGPWRSRWVRFGYRPEDHPVSRFVQIFEYRLSARKLRIWEEMMAVTGTKKDRGRRGETVVTVRTVQDGARTREGEAEGMETSVVPEGGEGGAGYSSGGVIPEIVLASTTKGRFASLLVLNGVQLSARNRQLICESPFRSVQELALTSPRLDKPDSNTGWWPQRTIDKMRQLTLEGIEECIKLKKISNATESSEGRRNKSHRLPKNIPRGEYLEAVSLREHDVEIVQATVPVPAQQTTTDVEEGPHEGVSSSGGGDGRKVHDSTRRGVEDDQELAMAKADRDTVATSEEEDSDSDDLNSSDLVDDSEDEPFSGEDDEDPQAALVHAEDCAYPPKDGR